MPYNNISTSPIQICYVPYVIRTTSDCCPELHKPGFLLKKKPCLFCKKETEIFRCYRKISKKTDRFMSFRLSVLPSVLLSACPHGKTRLPLDEFSWNFTFLYFLTICGESSIFVKIPIRITGTLHEYPNTFMIISRWILLTMRHFQIKK